MFYGKEAEFMIGYFKFDIIFFKEEWFGGFWNKITLKNQFIKPYFLILFILR